jgi:serine/threonine-protein kinase RsbW
VTGPVSHQIILAVDEACANCMIHQHNCDNQTTIEVSIYRKNQTLYTEIKDTGKAFRIDQYQPQQVSDIIEARGKGGLGINIIHRIMDEINVEEKRDYFIYRLGKIVGPEPSSQA